MRVESDMVAVVPAQGAAFESCEEAVGWAIELRHLRHAVAAPKRGSEIEELKNIAHWRANIAR
jgi:hypothetical protein